MQCLDNHPPSATLQISGRGMTEQIGGELYSADQIELRQFLLHTGTARPPRIFTEFQQHNEP
jgi:hypothetical protein